MTSTDTLQDSAPTTLRIVVSPGAGRIRLLPPRRFEGGIEIVERGQSLAVLEQGAARTDVLAPFAARVSSVLAIEGEPVTAGQALFAIDPQER